MIAALYVLERGPYFGLSDIDPWDKARDARLYDGPWPVIAHPPCQAWGAFADVNFKRWGGEHNRPGNDGGCFRAALNSVRCFGGVLEHPAFTRAWKAHDLLPPQFGKWIAHEDYWVTEVWQSAYGHRARKRTWLLYCGKSAPPPLRWERIEGTHQIGQHDQRGKERNKPTISGRAANETPIPFRDLLIEIATSASPAKR